MKLAEKRIAFIGAGNMASAIFKGLLARGMPASHIHATGLDAAILQSHQSELGIQCSQDNATAVSSADVIVLAVKPQQLREVCENLRDALGHQPLVISIAAGVSLALIEKWLGCPLPMVRSMPNTPAQVLSGATGLFANAKCSELQRALTEEMFSVIGLSQWLDNEDQLHAITALSGSGPAYLFYVIEAMEAAAIQLGLEPELARQFAAQTAKGAAEMVLQTGLTPQQLKKNVMSPGGTTERAISVLEQRGLAVMFADAMQAACARSEELAQLLAEKQ